jgi:hypothetical protein
MEPEARIRERAARIAKAGIMDEEEAVEMLAIANGIGGCREEFDEAGVCCRRSRGRLPTRANGPS